MKLPLHTLILALCSTALHPLYAAADEQKKVRIKMAKHCSILLYFSDETTIKELKEKAKTEYKTSGHKRDLGEGVLKIIERLSKSSFDRRLQEESEKDPALQDMNDRILRETRWMPPWWPAKQIIYLEDDKSCSHYGIKDHATLTFENS